MNTAPQTPMMVQWHACKEAAPDTILLFLTYRLLNQILILQKLRFGLQTDPEDLKTPETLLPLWI